MFTFLLVPLVPPVSLVPLVSPVPPVPLVSLVSLVSPVPQSPVRLALPIFSAFPAHSEKISFIASLYFRYRKDTRSPKDYRKMSEI